MAPDLGVISASHDKTLRLWSMDGTCLTVYEGHAEIVYTCVFSENRFIASGITLLAKSESCQTRCLQGVKMPLHGYGMWMGVA